jgi:hypothetical protein
VVLKLVNGKKLTVESERKKEHQLPSREESLASLICSAGESIPAITVLMG